VLAPTFLVRPSSNICGISENGTPSMSKSKLRKLLSATLVLFLDFLVYATTSKSRLAPAICECQEHCQDPSNFSANGDCLDQWTSCPSAKTNFFPEVKLHTNTTSCSSPRQSAPERPLCKASVLENPNFQQIRRFVPANIFPFLVVSQLI